MMMTSDPYYLLMKADTVKVIERIWHFREETGSKICFTLDAGANVHLLYPKAEKEKVKIFIDQELTQFCQEKAYIHDEVGGGVEV
jgi:diphosphomevalonate decarboxylase